VAAEEKRGRLAASARYQAGQHHAAAPRTPDPVTVSPAFRIEVMLLALPPRGLAGPRRAGQAGAAAIMTSAAAVPPDRTGIAAPSSYSPPVSILPGKNEPCWAKLAEQLFGQWARRHIYRLCHYVTRRAGK